MEQGVTRIVRGLRYKQCGADVMTRNEALTALAGYFARNPSEQFEELVQSLGTDERDGLRSTLKATNALQLLRRAAQAWSEGKTGADVLRDVQTLGDGSVLWRGDRIGLCTIWYRTAYPQEAQARMAYDSLLDRFLEFVAAKRCIVTLQRNEYAVTVFIPRSADDDLDGAWREFIAYAFSRGELEKTFLLMVNTIRLSDRGIGYIDPPAVSEEQKEMVAALYLATLKRRLGDGFDTAVQKLRTQVQNHRGLDNALALVPRFGRTAVEGFFQKANVKSEAEGASSRKNTIESAIRKTLDKPLSEIPCVLTDKPIMTSILPAGDQQRDVCYACGQPCSPSYRVNKLVFESPLQRRQSGCHKDEDIPCCSTCAALGIISPLKPSSRSVVVRLSPQGEAKQAASTAEYARMLTCGELSLAAGTYWLLRSETVGNEPVSASMGLLQYALHKVASVLPRAVLQTWDIRLVASNGEQRLENRHLVWLSYLLQVFEPRLVHKGKLNSACSEAVRLVQKDEVIAGIYSLMRAKEGEAIPVTTQNRYRMQLLEELRYVHHRMLREVKSLAEKAQLFRYVAAFTGLLYPFCERVRRELQGDPDTGKAQREVMKLIEEVTDPFQFSYRATHNLTGTYATLYRRDDNYFCFDEAEKLLGKLPGIDVANRRQEAGDGTPTLRVHFDDVCNAYSWLFSQQGYQSEKDQKEFTTKLRLSLAARFPDYIRETK